MKRLYLFLFAIMFALMSVTAAANAIREEDLRPHIEILASDAFEGREPGTEGERKTLEYLQKAWTNAGLKPGARNGSWLDPVMLVRRGPKEQKAVFFSKGEKMRFVTDEILLVGRDASYQTRQLPLVFAGYGVDKDGNVPANVAGKAVFILSDIADFLPENMRSTRSRREALVRSGAEAVISIAEEQFDYPVIRRAYLARPTALLSSEVRASMEGVVSAKFMVAMVTAAGGDWDKLRMAARDSQFGSKPLGVNADFDIATDVVRFESQNILGKIPGRKSDGRAIFFMAHWDHLGICRPEGDKDRICNGAVDNASGIAVLTEVARHLARKKHDRDIYFLATTAEETGLNGAQAFVDNPAVPLDKILLVLNIDTIAIAPKGAKIVIIGRGKTNLDPIIEAIAKKAKRKIEPSTDANAFLQRQDGWVFTQKGVPALMIGGAFADARLLEQFLQDPYHGPDDELRKSTPLGGAAEDATLHVLLGQHFANTKKYVPQVVPQVEAKKAGE
jgi:Peptidase family M28